MNYKTPIKYLALTAAALGMSSCTTMVEKASQDITVEAIGAREVWCYLVANEAKFKALPPQTLKIKKSRDDLIVDCYASGGRNLKKIIPSKFDQLAMANAVTGGLGLLYDLHTGAANVYPDRIVADFTTHEVKMYGLPTYMDDDHHIPGNEAIEDMGPTKTLHNRDTSAPTAVFESTDTTVYETPTASSSPKNLTAILDEQSENQE